MVARDGIEPPTPAFSGPRSTTELSGLGCFLAVLRDRQERPRTLTSVDPSIQSHKLLGGILPPVGNQRFGFIKYSNRTLFRQTHGILIST